MAFEISKYLLMLKLGKQPKLNFFVQFACITLILLGRVTLVFL